MIRLEPYKGYVGEIDIDELKGIFFGRVVGMTDVITFEGETVPELVTAFRESVEDYIAFCAEQGVHPLVSNLSIPEMDAELSATAHRVFAIIESVECLLYSDEDLYGPRPVVGSQLIAEFNAARNIALAHVCLDSFEDRHLTELAAPARLIAQRFLESFRS